MKPRDGRHPSRSGIILFVGALLSIPAAWGLAYLLASLAVGKGGAPHQGVLVLMWRFVLICNAVSVLAALLGLVATLGGVVEHARAGAGDDVESGPTPPRS